MPRSLVAVSVAVILTTASGSAFALSTKECSTKYQAAKQAGTLRGMSWNDFRKAECADAPAAAAAPVPNPLSPAAKATQPSPSAATTAKPPAAQAPTAAPATAAAKPAPAPAPPAATGQAVSPRAVDPKYASEPAGKARQHTCLDQYNANKTAGGSGNGGLNWIQKGGGYYSECNKRLKG
ncbi:hypothetical protein [Methylobacterium durans]|uniref:Uncharacterized protein n=1 Tax=Methylobacterium durans TaxID=2202825 RepID=A0A2U8W887_9HYPH|nr:hypothetical protein [Methylobacterium durans]AWN41720.1 hypothetical protein DK389_15900 [Methylobacterium durans]